MDESLIPDGIDCPLCENRGYIATLDAEGMIHAVPCKCMAQRRSLRLMRRSGLGDLFESCTLKNFKTPDEWTKRALKTAVDYCRNGRGKWFYIAGRPGTGKTHLCSAICRYLLKKGAPVRYMLWREEAPKLKALINDAEEYAREMDALANVSVLYIDDFMKGTVTEADKNLAFSLLNARYNSKNKRTIFSSERPLREIMEIDEATGSRIWQRSQGYILLAPPEQQNWRVK